MKRRKFSEFEVRRLKAFYPYLKTCDIAMVMRRPACSIYNKAHSLGVFKATEFDRHYLTGEEGKEFRFSKGHDPWNKGVKGLHFKGSEKGQFKKGHKPQTWVPVGTQVITDDGYLKIKISDDRTVPSRFNWKMAHVIEWENLHGPIPKGHIVVFRNGNRRDIRIENLEMITLAENMKRNTLHNLPPELKKVVYMKGALNRTISRLEKNEREQRTGTA